MSVVVSCPCGRQFKTDDRHAGKRVPCPDCGQVMQIPAAGAPAPPPFRLPPAKSGIRVQCPCGWAFRAPPASEGKTVRCPGCNGAIQVPAADPLGVGPLESIPAATLHSRGFGGDSTDRLARQLAWVAGGSVAVMLFAMFVTSLIFRFPQRQQLPVIAEGALPKQVVPQQPVIPNTVSPMPAPQGPSAGKPPSETPAPAADNRFAVAPPGPPRTTTAADALRDGDSADPFDRMKTGPRGPRFGPRGPRIGPRGPRIGPDEPNLAGPSPPPAATPAGDALAESSAPAPSTTADAGPPPVTRLPKSLQAWFEQPGDKLAGLRRVGSDKTPNTHFSWMTGLLPFLDQQQVYERFDFSQPVTSPRNLQAGSIQIPAFLNPLDDRKTWEGYPFDGMALTHFVGMSGVEDSRNVVAAKLPRSDPRAGVFGYDEVARPAAITDGQSQTIMMVGAGALPNPWMFGGGGTIRGAREPLFEKTSGLGSKGLPGGGAIVMMADGSVRHVHASVDPKVFRAMSTIHGSETVDLQHAPPYALDQPHSPAPAATPRATFRKQASFGR